MGDKDGIDMLIESLGANLIETQRLNEGLNHCRALSNAIDRMQEALYWLSDAPWRDLPLGREE